MTNTMTGDAHGTRRVYRRGCRCRPCRDASARYERDRVRQIAYGRWEPYVDAEPIRHHVNRLQASGLGWERIADLAGVSRSVVSTLLFGSPARGREPTQRIRPHSARRLLQVRPSVDHVADTALVDVTGTRRRLQALVAIGWSQARLAVRLDMHLSSLSRIMNVRHTVTASTARAVRSLYDQLWSTPPPQVEWRDKIAASRSRNVAAARGWAPPMAWDDDEIDDPSATAHGAAVRLRGARNVPEDVAWLADNGESELAIASRLGISIEAVRKALYRARTEVSHG
ncbi:helix-turn-helix domain-containing protein [Salininema proteolyticum]|uniref:Uncharacterized protein n=1 Tax=Salininema proteolyticum TaxID=1607685 RepID=A0ABV8TT32_9ACTN